MASSRKILRVLPLLWLGLRSGPRSFPLMGTGERPSRVKRGLGPSRMKFKGQGPCRPEDQLPLFTPAWVPPGLEPMASKATAQHNG